MTRADDRLADLLKQAVADHVDAVRFEDVARRVRRSRRAAAASATAVAVALIASAVVAATLRGPGRPALAAGGLSAAPASLARRVLFQGIAVTLPTGWTTARLICGWPADHTVAISDQAATPPQCPYRAVPTPRPTSITLTSIYGPRYADGWTGRPRTWHGQPAWLATQRASGLTTLTLTLPWLNAAVTAESPDPAEAMALLGRVAALTRPGLAVPRSASSVFIQSLAGRDGDHLQRNASLTSAARVRRVLADLQALPPARFRPACDGSWWPDTALITVHASDGSARTYAAQFGTCGEVVGGTGAAAAVSARLRADIRRLVPNSGL